MNTPRIVAFSLMVAGSLLLAYGNYGCTKETNKTQLGPLELSVNESHSSQTGVNLVSGIIFIGAGIAGGIWIRRRRFYRTNFAGAEEFNSFGAFVGSRLIEYIVIIAVIILIFVGIFKLGQAM